MSGSAKQHPSHIACDGTRDGTSESNVPREVRVEIEFAIQDGWRLCEQITREEARNFYYGLRLLPQAERSALYVVYAWMRVLDDIADDDGIGEAERRELLVWFERETRRAFGGAFGGSFDGNWYEEAARELAANGRCTRERYVFLALAQEVQLRRLHIDDFLAAIEGQRMDLAPRVYARFAETELYCDRVASTVGRICLDVWGVRAGADLSRARELSTARGIAFQLTNILRDVREDHARGRCYLPADELATHGLSIDALLAWQDNARCSAFMREQCARAARFFDESAALEGLVSERAVPTLAAMSVIYRRILEKIARDPKRALAQRVSLSRFEKVSIALRARFGLLANTRGGRA
jgi:phytoene synthase